MSNQSDEGADDADCTYTVTLLFIFLQGMVYSYFQNIEQKIHVLQCLCLTYCMMAEKGHRCCNRSIVPSHCAIIQSHRSIVSRHRVAEFNTQQR